MNKNRKIVLDTLNEQNIEYEMFEHQAVYTVDEIEDSDLWNHENGIGAKNLFLRDGSGKHHFLVIIREDKQADLKKVRDEIGSSRLSFASAERLMKYLNIEPGSVSPLGILNDKECVVPVFFDEDLKEYEYIAVHPNDNTATIWMKLTDLLDVIKMLYLLYPSHIRYPLKPQRKSTGCACDQTTKKFHRSKSDKDTKIEAMMSL